MTFGNISSPKKVKPTSWTWLDNCNNIVWLCHQVDRTKRIYFEDESRALDVRDRATDADDKARGRKKDIVSFFQSSAALKRHAGKLSAKQEEMDIR